MSLAFKKFFNSEEVMHIKLTGKQLKYWEIRWFHDSTGIGMHKWFAATTGTAEGEGEVNNKMGTTFNELFWRLSLKWMVSQIRLNLT
jgi:hypothetical protein